MNKFNEFYRKENRRIQERRTGSRRIIKHAFGSEAWKQAVQAAYVFWPKQDRRVHERRTRARRVAERRTGLTNYRRYSQRQLDLRRNGHGQRLTSEEINMLTELNSRS
ncbi:MAG: hypothetical protein P1P93_10870 [Gammaproteobacteria bacterium]|nr:hypothetical protein [Gammaproteobacteria bacterium]